MGQDLIDGALLRAWRIKDGMSQDQLAREAGISPQYLCDVEKGRRDVKPAVLAALAKALNIPKSGLEKRHPNEVAS